MCVSFKDVHDSMLYIVYPEQKWVTRDWIETQYYDAVANREVPWDRKATTVQEMANALDDAGIITQGRAA